jgi:hypothetical protein
MERLIIWKLLVDMYMQTTHNSVYRELPLSKNVPVRPSSAGKANNMPFDGTTNYSQNYKQWQVPRVEQHAREGYQPNNAPFEGMSTQKAHYIQPWSNRYIFRKRQFSVY